MSQRRFTTNLWTIVAAGILAVAVIACGSGKSAASSSSGRTVTKAASSTRRAASSRSSASRLGAQLAKYEKPGATPWTSPGHALNDAAKLRGKTVWYIPIVEAVPFFQAGILGLQQSLSHLGATLRVCDGGGNPSATSTCLNEAVKEGAAAVVADSISYDFAAQAFDAVIAAKVPLVFMNEPANAQNDQQASVAGNEGQQLTKLAADYIIEHSGGTAHVLVIEITDSSASVGYMEKGALQEFASTCSACKVTVAKIGTVQLSELPSLVSADLAKDPSINWVLPEFDADVEATVAGLETGNHSNVKVVSTTGVLSSLQLIKSGRYQVADVGASEYLTGWAATDQILRMMAGGPVDTKFLAPIRLFDESNVGSLSLTPAAYNNGSWYGAKDFEAKFLQLWRK